MNEHSSSLSESSTLVKRDYADWLSPIVVKELRQAIQSKSFILIFTLAQVGLLALIANHISSHNQVGDVALFNEFNWMFWMLVIIPLLLIIPMQGLKSLREEITANTLDLIQLTHLTSKQIVYGKWIAICTQSFLFVVALLPFVILRYFVGGIDLISELSSFAIILPISIMLSAITIALSCTPVLIRICGSFAMVIFIFSSMNGLGFLFGGHGRMMGLRGTEMVEWIVVLLIVSTFYILLSLHVGATQIASSNENHTTPKRLICIASILLPILASKLNVDAILFESYCFIMTPLWIICIADALSEKPSSNLSIYANFLKKPSWMRPFRWLLYPGRVTGVFFSTLIFALMLFTFEPFFEDNTPIILMAMTGSFFLPTLVLDYLPKIQSPFRFWILLQLLLLVCFPMTFFVFELIGFDDVMIPFTFIIPNFWCLAWLTDSGHLEMKDSVLYTLLPMASSFLIMALVYLRAFRQIRVMKQHEKMASSLHANTPPSTLPTLESTQQTPLI